MRKSAEECQFDFPDLRRAGDQFFDLPANNWRNPFGSENNPGNNTESNDKSQQ